MFYISSRGSSACTWLAKILSRHPQIVCFRASRSFPPTGQVPYQTKIGTQLTADEFMEGLMECEGATLGEKVFGSLHGYHGLDAKDPCEKRGGFFSFIVRHPLSRFHSAFIYYLFNFYYNKYQLGIENKDVHERSCSILSENVELIDDIDSSLKEREANDYIISDAYKNNMNFQQSMKKVFKRIVPSPIIDYAGHLKRSYSKSNKDDPLGSDIDQSNMFSIPDEKDHLCRVFIKMCKVFLPYDSIIYKQCPSSGIKMEEMVKSAIYFKDYLWKLVAPQLTITDNYLKSVFDSEVDNVNKWAKVSGQRFNVHRDNPLSPHEIWQSWPLEMRQVFRKYFDEYDCNQVCKAFDYDVSFME